MATAFVNIETQSNATRIDSAAIRRLAQMYGVVAQLNAVQVPMAGAIAGIQMQRERTPLRMAEELKMEASRHMLQLGRLQASRSYKRMKSAFILRHLLT